jgi:hypothetical protein
LYAVVVKVCAPGTIDTFAPDGEGEGAGEGDGAGEGEGEGEGEGDGVGDVGTVFALSPQPPMKTSSAAIAMSRFGMNIRSFRRRTLANRMPLRFAILLRFLCLR